MIKLNSRSKFPQLSFPVALPLLWRSSICYFACFELWEVLRKCCDHSHVFTILLTGSVGVEKLTVFLDEMGVVGSVPKIGGIHNSFKKPDCRFNPCNFIFIKGTAHSVNCLLACPSPDNQFTDQGIIINRNRISFIYNKLFWKSQNTPKLEKPCIIIDGKSSSYKLRKFGNNCK